MTLKRSVNLQLTKKKMIIAMDSLTSEEFSYLAEQLTDESLEILCKKLGDEGARLLRKDIESLRASVGHSENDMQSTSANLEVSTVTINIPDGRSSVQTDGTPGYKGVEQPW